VNNVETLDYAEAVSSVYYITLSRLISTLSASKITVLKVTTKSTITPELPSAVQVSGAPMTGYYRIKCIHPEGYESYTNDINLGWNAAQVQNAIMGGCDRMYDLIQVLETVDYPYSNMGKAFLIRFIGINAKPG
jgi:hypothetical protein